MKKRQFQVNGANQIEFLDPTGTYIEDTWEATFLYKDYRECRTKAQFFKKLKEDVLSYLNGQESAANQATRIQFIGRDKEFHLSCLWKTIQRLNAN